MWMQWGGDGLISCDRGARQAAIVARNSVDCLLQQQLKCVCVMGDIWKRLMITHTLRYFRLRAFETLKNCTKKHTKK